MLKIWIFTFSYYPCFYTVSKWPCYISKWNALLVWLWGYLMMPGGLFQIGGVCFREQMLRIIFKSCLMRSELLLSSEPQRANICLNMFHQLKSTLEMTTPSFSIVHRSITRDNLNSEIQKQAWLLRRPFTRSRFVSHTPELVCSDKSTDWLASANVARDRKHSPSLSNNYPSLHASCQRTNSSVIIPLLPVESGWQRAQYQSHSITLLLAFISSTLTFTMKDGGFYFTLKTNVSACSAWTLLHIHTESSAQYCVIETLHQFHPNGSTSGSFLTNSGCSSNNCWRVLGETNCNTHLWHNIVKY